MAVIYNQAIMNIFEELKRLGLPTGQYVVFGGGSMAAHGIRMPSDIDILVTNELYERLREQGWQDEEEIRPGLTRIVKDKYDVTPDISCGSYNPNKQELIDNAKIINGIPFLPLNELIKFKKEKGREKDLKDIELIKKYLEGPK